MTEPPAGWSSPSGEQPPTYGAPPPPAYGAPPPGYGAPPAYAGPPGGWYGGPPPAPTPGVVPLRPLTIGELLDGAVKVIRRHPKPTIGLSALVALVSTLLNLLAVVFIDFSEEAAAFSSDEVSNDITFGGSNTASIPGALFSIPAGLFLTGVLVVVVGRAVLGQEAAFSDVWQQLRPRLLTLIGLSLLSWLIMVGPFLVVAAVAAFAWLAGGGGAGLVLALVLLGLPAMALSAYLYVRLSLAPAVLVLEKSGVRTSLQRSGALVRGSWWRVFGILVLTQVIGQLVAGVLVVPVTLVSTFTLLDQPSSTDVAIFVMISQVVSGLASCLISPFTAGVRALLYVDRRMRAEALDLTLQAAART